MKDAVTYDVLYILSNPNHLRIIGDPAFLTSKPKLERSTSHFLLALDPRITIKDDWRRLAEEEMKMVTEARRKRDSF